LTRRKARRNPRRSITIYYLIGGVAVAAIVGYLLVSAALQGQGSASRTTSRTTSQTTSQQTSVETTSAGSKPIILYVNQGNGVVNESNFGELVQTATSHGFNTIFFQIYRSGSLLFSDYSLGLFVTSAHEQGLRIFFALYFTGASQTIPTSIFSGGEDGISLDMSTLPLATQMTLFDYLSTHYAGKTAITTTDPTIPLSPDLLVVETYGAGNDQYIHPGMVASVEVVAASSRQQYQQQFQYALNKSDGVMVFDYAGLVKSGY
jgi:hypothetical protein